MNLIQISAELRPQAAARLAVPPTEGNILLSAGKIISSTNSQFYFIDCSLVLRLQPAGAEDPRPTLR